jgi:glutathione S-transferase
MVKYRLVYFDFKGKGELARLIFAAARQDYEDVRYEYSPDSEQWLKYKPKTPFGRLPVLEILNDDGKVVNRLAQSVAIGKKPI